MKKNQSQKGNYHVYLNKDPHLPEKIGRKLFFESHNYNEAVTFSERLVGTMVQWFLEDYRFYGHRDHQIIESFRKFIVNFWIEPVGDTPTPLKPFCARRHAAKLLEPYPTILAKVTPYIFGSEAKN